MAQKLALFNQIRDLILSNNAADTVSKETQTEFCPMPLRVVQVSPRSESLPGKRPRYFESASTPESYLNESGKSPFPINSPDEPITVERSDSDSSIVVERHGHTHLATVVKGPKTHSWKSKVKLKTPDQTWLMADDACFLPVMNARDKVVKLLTEQQGYWLPEQENLTTLQLFCMLKKASPGLISSEDSGPL